MALAPQTAYLVRGTDDEPDLAGEHPGDLAGHNWVAAARR